jgi:hypothetical protein
MVSNDHCRSLEVTMRRRFFLMTGAALSHAFADDYGDHGFNLILPPWALRPKSRKL